MTRNQGKQVSGGTAEWGKMGHYAGPCRAVAAFDPRSDRLGNREVRLEG
jgi:hypothetical protein